MDYTELNAMLEVPDLMVRGKPCAVIMGSCALMTALNTIPMAVFDADMTEDPIRAGMTLMGLPVYVPERHPDAAFAVTRDELERVLQNIGPLVKTNR
jgi:hypothetical protein